MDAYPVSGGIVHHQDMIIDDKHPSAPKLGLNGDTFVPVNAVFHRPGRQFVGWQVPGSYGCFHGLPRNLLHVEGAADLLEGFFHIGWQGRHFALGFFLGPEAAHKVGLDHGLNSVAFHLCPVSDHAR